MKKLVLVIVAIIAMKAAGAQDTARYLPAFEPGQRWHEARIMAQTSETAQCAMDSTTVEYDSGEYYKIRLKGLNQNAGFYWDDGVYHMRQTADHSRVYVKVWQYDEQLSYDMTLQVGDTFGTVLSNRGEVYLVVDSVYYRDGRKRIRFSRNSLGVSTGADTIFHEFYKPLEFVEGIGPTWGWLWREDGGLYIEDVACGVMLCVWRNGEQINEDIAPYLEEHPDRECTLNLGLPVTGIKQPSYEAYTLYPNPVSETLTIAGLPDSRVQVEVYDVAGNLLLRKEASASDPGIDLSHLRRQMLLVRITTNEGCSTYKVMKL